MVKKKRWSYTSTPHTSSCRSARSGKYRDNLTFRTSTCMRNLEPTKLELRSRLAESLSLQLTWFEVWKDRNLQFGSELMGTFILNASVRKHNQRIAMCHFLIRLSSTSLSLSLYPYLCNFFPDPSVLHWKWGTRFRNQTIILTVIILYRGASNKAKWFFAQNLRTFTWVIMSDFDLWM
jgi:hypothetical protein